MYCIYCIQNVLFLWVNLDQAHICSLYYFTFINNKYTILSIEYEVFFKNLKTKLYKKTNKYFMFL